MAGMTASALAGALMNSERRFQAIAETSLQGKLVHRRFKPLYANTAFAYLCGCDRAEDILARDTVLDLMDEETRAAPDAAWVRLLHGPTFYGRRTLLRRDGSPYTGDLYARAVHWDGEPAIALAVVDVTEEERAQQALRDAQAQAEAAARAKRRFLAAASHELRTPLHGALGRLEVLCANLGDPRNEVLARDALDACRDLSRRIDDVLDAAALESSAMVFAREPFVLTQILNAALSDVRLAAEAAQIRLAEPLVDPEARLMGDARAVRRIAATLLEAAVRRLPSRCVSLETQTDEAGLAISVRAEGVLRAPPYGDGEDMTFNPLATAKRLTQAHGGVLVEWAQTPEAWSASAYLKLERLDTPAVATPRAALEVLVVEDNPGARGLLKVALETLAHAPTLAADGAEALALVKARPFDVVLMDLHMPGMDGCETARAIRALKRPWARLPIAALTASSAQGVREQISEAGMDAFLRKPVDIPHLAETIALLAQRSVEAAKRDQVQRENEPDKAGDNAQSNHDRSSQ